MSVLFCVRPTMPNIGNDVIQRATRDLLCSVFGPETVIVPLPALENGNFGGLGRAQVYDMNRLADGVVIGGGNLFENGQLTVDPNALRALHVPIMLMGLSHGRIYDSHGELVDRTDSLPPDSIRLLCDKASVVLVRDHGSKALLDDMGLERVEVGGCPSMYAAPHPPEHIGDGRVLISIRHPAQMCVPPPLQGRVASDVHGLIAALTRAYGDVVSLVCHDYKDIEFARSFPRTPLVYFDQVDRYLDALRTCRLNVTYRLHAFLPCLSFATPAIHLSYDERGKAMLETAGMGEWDIDLIRERDVVGAVMRRAGDVGRYHQLRAAAQASIDAMQAAALAGARRFSGAVTARERRSGRACNAG